MLFATVLALGSAVLHAGWNLVAKRANGDRFVVLWAQFAVAGAIAGVVLAVHAAFVGMPASAYGWAGLSGLVHLPYVWLLARAYTVADFSVSYPIARGGGALLAAVGGVALLGDHLSAGELLGIAVVAVGLSILSWKATRHGVALALMVAVTVGTYTTLDAQGSRSSGSLAYVLATYVAGACTISIGGVVSGRGAAFVLMLRTYWRRAVATAIASVITYGMVLLAIRHAPVGYVAALRESSVVLAALVGWKLLGEGDPVRRITATIVVVAGLMVLVFG
ncbi:MAG: EamA family transporter [Ilumatobacteraceae bacterium]